MYTILLSLLSGILIGVGLSAAGWTGWVGSVTWGVLAAVACYGVAAWRLRRVLARPMGRIQEIMSSGQKQIQREVQLLQSRPTGNPKQSLQKVEALQREVIRRGLAATDALEPYRPWVPLLSRQVATLRMQLYYQLQEFDRVDELLPKCLLLDPGSLAMKLAQMHRRGADLAAMRKVFDRGVARLKYNQSALLYSLMAWLLLQHRREEEAHTLLLDACRRNENETLKRNRDRLANNRAREFSNAGLGDEWFALFLEQPKITTRRIVPRADGRPF